MADTDNDTGKPLTTEEIKAQIRAGEDRIKLQREMLREQLAADAPKTLENIARDINDLPNDIQQTDSVIATLESIKRKIRDIQSTHKINWDTLLEKMKNSATPATTEKNGLTKAELTKLYYDGQSDMSLPKLEFSKDNKTYLNNNYNVGEATVNVKYWVK